MVYDLWWIRALLAVNKWKKSNYLVCFQLKLWIVCVHTMVWDSSSSVKCSDFLVGCYCPASDPCSAEMAPGTCPHCCWFQGSLGFVHPLVSGEIYKWISKILKLFSELQPCSSAHRLSIEPSPKMGELRLLWQGPRIWGSSQVPAQVCPWLPWSKNLRYFSHWNIQIVLSFTPVSHKSSAIRSSRIQNNWIFPPQWWGGGQDGGRWPCLHCPANTRSLLRSQEGFLFSTLPMRTL